MSGHLTNEAECGVVCVGQAGGAISPRPLSSPPDICQQHVCLVCHSVMDYVLVGVLCPAACLFFNVYFLWLCQRGICMEEGTTAICISHFIPKPLYASILFWSALSKCTVTWASPVTRKHSAKKSRCSVYLDGLVYNFGSFWFKGKQLLVTKQAKEEK